MNRWDGYTSYLQHAYTSIEQRNRKRQNHIAEDNMYKALSSEFAKRMNSHLIAIAQKQARGVATSSDVENLLNELEEKYDGYFSDKAFHEVYKYGVECLRDSKNVNANTVMKLITNNTNTYTKGRK